ncbi:MAG TPA: tetratricopeptide repeat protein [bacterium]|nr:tetratricopeptide repeat protein [bacterium]
MRKTFIFYFFLLFFIACFDYKTYFAWNAYRKGIKAEREGNLDKAINYYLLDIKKYPTKTRSRIALADVLYTKAYYKKDANTDSFIDWKNALIANEIAYEINSDTERKNILLSCFLNIIQNQLKANNIQNADNYMQVAKKYFADNKKFLIFEAQLLSHTANIESEIETYKNILLTEQDNETALNNLSLLCLNKNDTQSIKPYLIKAIQKNPNSIAANKFLGLLNLQDNNINDAILNFKKVLEFKPNDIESLNNISLCYIKTGDYYLALKNFEKILEINPLDFETFFNIGRLYFLQANYYEAIENFRKALLLNENHFDSLVNLAIAYKYNNEFDKSISTFEKIINIKEDFFLAYENLIYLYKTKKNNQVMAEYYLNKYKKLNKDIPDSFNNLLEN